MYIRVSTVRFPNQTKADAWIALFQSTLLNKFERDSKLKKITFFYPGEGKVTAIATYDSEEEYLKTEKSIKNEVNDFMKSLDGTIEWQAGKVVLNWDR